MFTQIASCLVAVAVSGPVPQQKYQIRRPQGGVSLHAQARQLNNLQVQQPFSVQLDDSIESDTLSLQGVGSFAGNVPSHRNQFTVELDDFSLESEEIISCPKGQLRHGNRCVVPRINRNIFVFGKDDPPEQKSVNLAALPFPQLDYNIIFVRSNPARAPRPLVIPPPQKKTVVYVLEDEYESAEDFVEVPSYPDADPEVYYVKVRPGENPQLPGGIDLQTAYSQAIQPFQSVDNDFDSSIELTIGTVGAPNFGTGFVGVPLPNVDGSGDFSSNVQGTASFNSANTGFSASSGLGVSLPSFQGSANFGASGSGVGFENQNLGVSLPPFQGSANFGASGSGVGFENQNIGVSLPSFQGSANLGASGSGVGFENQDTFDNSAFSSNSGFADNQGFDANQGFSSNAGFAGDAAFTGTDQLLGDNNAGFNTFAAKGLDVEIENGRVKVEPASREIVQRAIRYTTPI